MRKITLRQLRTFAAVVRHGTMAAAAQTLGLTPPAVSIQIRQLEDHAGVALLERTTQGLRMTDAGNLILDAAVRIDAVVEECAGSLEELAGLTGGRASVGVVSTAKYFAPQALAVFSRAHPGVDLRLTIGNRDETVAALKGYEIDMAIMGRPPTGVDVEQAVIGAHPHVIIAAPDHHLTTRARSAPKVLMRETLLMREPGSGTRALFQELFTNAGLEPPQGMEMGSNETIKQAVMAGLGIAMISAHTVAAELSDGRLRALDIKGLPVMRTWFMVKRTDKRLLPASRALWQFMAREGHTYLPDLAGAPGTRSS